MAVESVSRKTLDEMSDRELLESQVRLNTHILIELRKITTAIESSGVARLRLPSWLKTSS